MLGAPGGRSRVQGTGSVACGYQSEPLSLMLAVRISSFPRHQQVIARMGPASRIGPRVVRKMPRTVINSVQVLTRWLVDNRMPEFE